jgi:hypothetical protein
MERGTIATPFEYRPPNIELKLCEYYYERVFYNEIRNYKFIYDPNYDNRTFSAIIYPNTIKITTPTLTITPPVVYIGCTRVSESYIEPYIFIVARENKFIQGFITQASPTTFELTAEYSL